MTAPSLTSLNGSHVDVAIIGAGINGASAAQHLSAEGYRVLVVDQGDFADGATSRSSRLLHCGLRHLATGSSIWATLSRPHRFMRAIGIVRADMKSRDEIVRSIPHRVRPFNFCLPIYSDDPYAPWQMDAAFSVLRMMSPTGVPLDYRRYSPGGFGEIPFASWLRDPDQLRGMSVFREYQFDWAERIALDALFDARRMGARIHNYTRVEGLEPVQPGGDWRLALRAMTTNDRAQVTASLVLNLAGAWVDQLNRQAGRDISQKCVGLKGVHIALRLPDEFADWGLFAYNSIGEPLYCLPWQGMHYVGLSRTPFEGDAREVVASDEEIDWMIGETNRCLPGLAVKRSDVLFSWAGVQPVTYDPEDPKGNREIKIHDLAEDGLPGILTLTGGPIMTHRRVADRLVRLVSGRIPPSGSSQSLCFEQDDPHADANARRIVSEAASISVAAVERCAREEQPTNLADLLMRRLGLGWNRDQGVELARAVAETAAPHLGWSKERIDSEVAEYEVHLRTSRRRPGSEPQSKRDRGNA